MIHWRLFLQRAALVCYYFHSVTARSLQMSCCSKYNLLTSKQALCGVIVWCRRELAHQRSASKHLSQRVTQVTGLIQFPHCTMPSHLVTPILIRAPENLSSSKRYRARADCYFYMYLWCMMYEENELCWCTLYMHTYTPSVIIVYYQYIQQWSSIHCLRTFALDSTAHNI